jgi:hypothetical protein
VAGVVVCGEHPDVPAETVDVLLPPRDAGVVGDEPDSDADGRWEVE